MIHRDHTLDIIRGFAVFLMIQGNIVGGIFEHPYPKWIEWYVFFGSVVPALFILVSGMAIVYTTIHKKYTIKHYLIRASMVMFAGAILLDTLVFGIIPFTTVDVLYLISIGMVASYYFQKLQTIPRWTIVGIIFLVTPMLQYYFGYTAYPTEYPIIQTLSYFFSGMPYSDSMNILSGPTYISVTQTSILQHWFIDGWFPIFPWIGFSFLGVNLGIMRWKDKTLPTFATKKIIITAVGLLVLSFILWSIQSQQLVIRAGFSESIYPVTWAYVSMAMGEILLFLALINWKTNIALYKPLIVFGQSALFMYIFHFALMQYVWPVLSTQNSLLLVIFATLISVLLLGYLLQRIRKRYPNRPFIVKLFGI